MSKHNNTLRFVITLTNAANTFKVYTTVYARSEDEAMDIALRRYNEQELEVYDTEVL